MVTVGDSSTTTFSELESLGLNIVLSSTGEGNCNCVLALLAGDRGVE